MDLRVKEISLKTSPGKRCLNQYSNGINGEGTEARTDVWKIRSTCCLIRSGGAYNKSIVSNWVGGQNGREGTEFLGHIEFGEIKIHGRRYVQINKPEFQSRD